MFEQCLEIADIDILHAVSEYREEYLDDSYWMTLSEKYAELYMQAAADINHPYIALVRSVYIQNVPKVVTPTFGFIAQPVRVRYG